MSDTLDERLPPPEIDPFSRAVSGLIPGIALIAVVSVAMVPYRDRLGSGTAAILLLIPVLVATIGGVWIALAVAVLGAATLNYFFTTPYDTLRIESAEGIVAFLSYVGVAVAVAIVLSRRRDAVRLAGRRGRDAQFVLSATTELAASDELDESIAHTLSGLLIAAHLRGARLSAGDVDEGAGAGVDPGSREQFALRVGGSDLGTLVVDPGAEPLAGDRRRLIEEVAAVFALALASRQSTTTQL